MTSKKLTEVLDHSAANFMVGCTLLILSTINLNLLSHKKSCGQGTSTVNTVYIQICLLSLLPVLTQRKCYEEVPIAIVVPSFCLGIFFPNVNMLIFNTTSVTVSVETYYSFQLSSRSLNADRPST